MRRGTTPIIRIEFDFETSTIEEAIVTFKQKNEVILEKKLENCTCEEKALKLQLTQEETLSFKIGTPLLMQVKAKLTAGDVIATDPYSFIVEEVYNEEVI